MFFMAKSGPILIIEDDPDDQDLIRDVLQELNINNKVLFFDKSPDAIAYLKASPEQPFIILSDINLPEQNGVEFKRQLDLDPQLRSKSVPFVFFSTSVNKETIDIAYKELTIQGYFQKTNSYEELRETIKLILDYWRVCKHPNSV